MWLEYKDKASGAQKALYFQPVNGKGPHGITISERFEGSTQITQNPVDEGANVSDHARDEPDFYTCIVCVSNSPLVVPDGESGSVKSVELDAGPYTPGFQPTPGGLTRAASSLITTLLAPKAGTFKASVLKFDKPVAIPIRIWGELETIRTSHTPVQVHAFLRDYKNMMIEKVGAPRDSETGDALEFTIDFRQVTTASTSQVQAPAPAEIRGALKKALGGKSTKEVQKPELKSLAAKILDGLG